MKRKNGFTLTEVLLAVMIVALIGVALASLTTAASRESSLGNTKILLRNNLSSALRQIRADIQDPSTRVVKVYTLPKAVSAFPEEDKIPLLTVVKGESNYKTYCFELGGTEALPHTTSKGNARSGGNIFTIDRENGNECITATPGIKRDFLKNVKFIPNENGYRYPTPLFKYVSGGGIFVRLLLEAPGSQPVANVSTEEVFFASSEVVEE